MSILPKYTPPEYTYTSYTTGKEIKYRPFTVAEQKILLLAKESAKDGEEVQQVIDSIGRVISQCTFGQVSVDDIPFFEAEELFLKLRSKSVSNETNLSFKVKDGDKINVKVNLDDVKLQVDDAHDKVIRLSDDMGLVLRYPTLTMIYNSSDESELLLKCIDSVFVGDEVTSTTEVSKDELEQWVNELDFQALAKIKTFFDTMPRLRHTVKLKYRVKDEEGNTVEIKESDYTLEGLLDFFG